MKGLILFGTPSSRSNFSQTLLKANMDIFSLQITIFGHFEEEVVLEFVNTHFSHYMKKSLLYDKKSGGQKGLAIPYLDVPLITHRVSVPSLTKPSFHFHLIS